MRAILTRLLLAVCRRWDDRMQVAAPDTPVTVWFPEDGFVDRQPLDPFRAPPTSEMRWAMSRCTGHGGVASVRYCEDKACVQARAEHDAWVQSQGDAA